MSAQTSPRTIEQMDAHARHYFVGPESNWEKDGGPSLQFWADAFRAATVEGRTTISPRIFHTGPLSHDEMVGMIEVASEYGWRCTGVNACRLKRCLGFEFEREDTP